MDDKSANLTAASPYEVLQTLPARPQLSSTQLERTDNDTPREELISGKNCSQPQFVGTTLHTVEEDMKASTIGGKLSILDRFLPVWLLLAAGVGLGLGQLSSVQHFIDTTTSVGNTNILVAIGLLVMMFPPLAKVRWNLLHRKIFSRKWSRLLILTTIQNWIIGPFLMYFLSILFFSAAEDQGLRAGLCLVGCARCIAMVMIWISIAEADEELGAAIVGINSIITIALYSPYADLFINTLPGSIFSSASSSETGNGGGGGGAQSVEISVSLAQVAVNVVIYMGIPFAAAILSWITLTRWKGTTWYYENFAERIEIFAILSLLFTVAVIFASQGQQFTANIGQVLYGTLPLLIYFITMFISSFFMAKGTIVRGEYPQAAALAFTAASNNFELSLAISVSTFGLKSDVSLMSVVGALIEIPTMLALIYLSFWLRSKCFNTNDGKEEEEGSCQHSPLSPSTLSSLSEIDWEKSGQEEVVEERRRERTATCF